MKPISVHDLWLSYPVIGQRSRSVKGQALHRLSFGRIHPEAMGATVVEALRGISFSVDDGDRIALVGRNGAGKSTLLRVLAGIHMPTRGEVVVNGRISSVLALNVGLSPEATGHDNIRILGLLMGMSAREIEERAPAIAEFTELGEALDLPVHTYSSGMSVRLSFAVCISMMPDILLLDEWIGVGDKRFIEKAKRAVRSLVDRARVLVLATHNEQIARSICNKAILLERGLIKASGPTETVLEVYT